LGHCGTIYPGDVTRLLEPAIAQWLCRFDVIAYAAHERVGSLAIRYGKRVELTGDGDDSPGQHRELLVLLESEVGADDDERELLARQLKAELTELDIESLTPVGGRPAPVGSKGTDTWGDWLITLSASGGVFTTILVTIQGWLGRHRGEHKVKVIMDGDTLELSGASTTEQAEIVRAFLRRHSAG
jgi:membrane-associated two-gene conflict system component 1 (EACC1)